MIDGGELDPIGFVGAELIARGGLVDRTGGDALVVLPAAVAARLVVPEVFTLAEAARPDAIGCGFGAPLLDLLTTEVRATVPVATVIWSAEPARAAVAERVAARLVARNGVVDVIGTGTAAATYLIGVFAWSARAMPLPPTRPTSPSRSRSARSCRTSGSTANTSISSSTPRPRRWP